MKTRSQALAEKKTAEFEKGANAEQLEVIRHEGGACRVLAAAGSGKTFAVVRRIARLVRLDILAPDRIFAVTFSKKAGDEMNKRVKQLIGDTDASIGTWHSWCLKVLRQDKTRWADWTIDGANDTPQKAKSILKNEVLGYKGMDWKGADLTKVANFIGRCKANLLDPSSDGARVAAENTFAWAAPQALRAFQLYNDALEEKELLTYDDFMVFVHRYFLENEDARQRWAAKYDDGMCDETQDNNRAQWTLFEMLFRDNRNCMAIGDVFQAIYGFRGSSPDYLANFEQHWPGAKTIWLPRNYRSGRKIIEAANNIVRSARVPGHEPKDMIGERDLDGEVRVICAEALDDEANEVANLITQSVDSKQSEYEDHTVLYRTNAQSRGLEEAFLKRRVPYIVVGGVSFYERKEVKDLLAYLRLAADRATMNDVERSINTPFRFLGKKFVERVTDEVDKDTLGEADWIEIVSRVAAQERIQARQRTSAHEWADMVRTMRSRIELAQLLTDAPEPDEEKAAKIKKDASPAELLEYVVRETRYIDWLRKEEGEETSENSAAANVREMIRVAERFSSAAEVLDYIDDTIKQARKQRNDRQAGGNRVVMMSIHRSKGLEWPHVYVIGMNEMILPHVKGDPEEERRLAYVAATRARDVLTMSWVRRMSTRAGVTDTQPSRYLVDTGLDVGRPALPASPDQEVVNLAALPPADFRQPDFEDNIKDFGTHVVVEEEQH